MAGTALPMTAVPSILFRLDMMVIDVINQVLEELEELVTLWARQGSEPKQGAGPAPTTLPSPDSPWPIDTPAAWPGAALVRGTCPWGK